MSAYQWYTVTGFTMGPTPSDIYVEDKDGKRFLLPFQEAFQDEVVGTKLSLKPEDLKPSKSRFELVAMYEMRLYPATGGQPMLGITDVMEEADLEEDPLFNALWDHTWTMVDGVNENANRETARRVAAAYAVTAFGPDMLMSV